jgi:ParB/RepB/Spo0J family partition protein
MKRHPPTEVDLHRLELRFKATRLKEPAAIRRLVDSLQDHGQRRPVVVVAVDAMLVLLDGYRRVEALRRLGRDTVLAERWDGALSEALLQVMAQHQGRRVQAIEEAWLIAGLLDEGMSQATVAAGLGKDKSWVSRRLALVRELPEPVQEVVRDGTLSSWAANRIVLPLARANPGHATALLEALRNEPLSTRQLSAWFAQYLKAGEAQRERLVEHPHLLLKALNEAQRGDDAPVAPGPEGQWLADLKVLERRLRRLLWALSQRFDLAQDSHCRQRLRAAFAAVVPLFERLHQALEHNDVISQHTPSPARAASTGGLSAGHQPPAEGLPQHGSPSPTRDAAPAADPKVAARHLEAARALLQGPGQCGPHPGADT